MVIEFQVEVDEKSGIPAVRVRGEIDVYTCPKLHQVFTDILENGNQQLLLNLENIQYIDSTGLGTIAHAAKTLAKTEGEVLIVCDRPQIKKIFEISGLDKKNIRIFDSEILALGEHN